MKVETSLEKMTIFQCNSKTKMKTIHQGEPFEHHIYENKWISRPSKPHPTLMAHLKPLPEDHISFGHPLKDNAKMKGVTLPMIADSGCQEFNHTHEHGTIYGVYREHTSACHMENERCCERKP